MSGFDGLYARAYDALYARKPYGAEVELLADVMDLWPRSHVVDVGCGTGRHARVFADMGFDVTGLDLSADLIAIARERVPEAAFRVGDMRSARVWPEEASAVVCLYAALGYLETNADVQDVFKNARACLPAGGRFAFDVWYGPAVLASPPTSEYRQVRIDGDWSVLRTTTPTMHRRRSTCELRYDLTLLANGRLVEEHAYAHEMRYFFEPELEHLLALTGFQRELTFAWPSPHTPPSKDTWQLGVVAVAVD